MDALDQALDHFAQQSLLGNGQRAMLRASRKSRSSARLGGWLCYETPFVPAVGQSCGEEQYPQERESWICKGCRMRKVFSSLATSSA